MSHNFITNNTGQRVLRDRVNVYALSFYIDILLSLVSFGASTAFWFKNTIKGKLFINIIIFVCSIKNE